MYMAPTTVVLSCQNSPIPVQAPVKETQPASADRIEQNKNGTLTAGDFSLAMVQGLCASSGYVFWHGSQVYTSCYATPKRRLQVESRKNGTENSIVYSKQ
ncbi:hypothetical protein FQA39_LY17344 [Lamprigera yunnana]|nr:hypothetical protein FQA39_LY17344 [Lamprigera yunnana]